MDSGIAIRRVQASDAQFVAELLAELGYPAPAADIPSRFAAIENFPKSLALVAVDGDEVVGVVTGLILPSIHAREPIAWLTTIVVAASHRGRGVGSRLVSEVERWAAGHGAIKVSLTSGLHRKETHEFYENRHYERSGLRFSKAID
jgi:GNAT superfamily N-acetyltransferase